VSAPAVPTRFSGTAGCTLAEVKLLLERARLPVRSIAVVPLARLVLRISISWPAASAQLTLDKREGPGREPQSRIMPNFDFNYVYPVNRNFGFTVNGLYSKQLVIQYNVATGWAPNNETELGVPADNPYLRMVDLQNSVKATVRRSGSTRFDLRLAERHVFSFDIEYNTYSTNFDGNNLIFDSGTMTPTAAARGQWSSTFTQGRAGQGLIRFSGNRRHVSRIAASG